MYIVNCKEHIVENIDYGNLSQFDMCNLFRGTMCSQYMRTFILTSSCLYVALNRTELTGRGTLTV